MGSWEEAAEDFEGVDDLLDVGEAFPSGAFASEEALPLLERLGLRVEVTRGAVLQSARSIEALAATEPERAHRRARALLSYVDARAFSLGIEPSAVQAPPSPPPPLPGAMPGSTPATT